MLRRKKKITKHRFWATKQHAQARFCASSWRHPRGGLLRAICAGLSVLKFKLCAGSLIYVTVEKSTPEWGGPLPRQKKCPESPLRSTFVEEICCRNFLENLSIQQNRFWATKQHAQTKKKIQQFRFWATKQHAQAKKKDVLGNETACSGEKTRSTQEEHYLEKFVHG